MKPVRILFLALVLCVSTPWTPVRASDVSEVVAPDQVPAAVKKAVILQLRGWTLGTIERYQEEGRTLYSVKLTKGDDDRYFTVAEDGSLVEVEVDLAETPPVVQKAIATQIGRGTLDAISKSIEDGSVIYDVDWIKGDEDHSFTVGADGVLLSIEVKLAETPPAVQAAITAHAAGGQVHDIEKTFDEGQVSYDVEYTGKKGGEQSFSVADDGRLLSVEVKWDELPGPVKDTISAKLAGGQGVRVDRVFEGKRKGAFDYEVEGAANGQSITFRVGPKGKFLGND